MNKVVHGQQAQELILQGAEELYNAVKTTYGPTSGNVGIIKDFGGPTVTHDGVTVARSIELEGDHRIGAEIIKQIATKMDDNLGDGTTTVTILAYHILAGAADRLLVGANPMLLRKELEADAKTVIAKLPDYSEVADTKKKVSEISTISSGDTQIGELIGGVMDKIGKDGTVTVEDGTGFNVEAEVVEGFTFDRGFVSPYFVTNQERMEAVLEDPYIVLCPQRISSDEEMTSILSKLAGEKKDLLLIVDDIDEAPLAKLIYSNLKGLLRVAVVKSPSFAEQRLEILEDIAALTNGATIGNAKEFKAGRANKVIITQDKTTIIGGKGDIKTRLKYLEEQIKLSTDEFKTTSLTKRKADLMGKVAVIRVGGLSETEIKEKKFRVDDAVFAAKAALEEGTVPGGATTLLNLSKELPENSLLKYALEQPFNILLENAGMSSAQDYVELITTGRGLNTVSGEIVDLRASGIIDPTKTIRLAIENAVSVAGTALTMKAIVVEVKKDKDE